MTIDFPCLIAGEPVDTADRIPVEYPYTGERIGSVASLTADHVERAIAAGAGYSCELTRYERATILNETAEAIEAAREEFAELITLESGLCVRETRYEVGRALDVLRFAAIEALRDDGQIFSCDVSPQGKARRIYTSREPLGLVVAITPFNHPLNTVVHKLAPAIAAGVPLILKPSEKTPLTAIRLARLLHAKGLPGPMLSVVLGPTDRVAARLVRSDAVEAVTFTGSTVVGMEIARTAGYKKLALELGGNAPLIVFDDADLDLATRLAAEGAYRNSGQRCTAVKRILAHEPIAGELTRRLVGLTAEYAHGDPRDEATRMGTVIDAAAARTIHGFVEDAAALGARVLTGGSPEGAYFPATVIAEVPREARIMREEAFGPLAPVFPFTDLEDAIGLANASPFGLSCGVVTNRLDRATSVIRGVRTGTVNVNEVPGYRLEFSPFGGVKASGLGVKEGVIEAMRWMTAVKTYSMPW